MANILISGIEMPKSGYVEMLLKVSDGEVYYNYAGDREVRAADYIPLTERCGRCIDADALLQKLLTRKDGSRRNDRDSDGWPNLLEVETVRTAIEEAVTIIEASEEKGSSEDV